MPVTVHVTLHRANKVSLRGLVAEPYHQAPIVDDRIWVSVRGKRVRAVINKVIPRRPPSDFFVIATEVSEPEPPEAA